MDFPWVVVSKSACPAPSYALVLGSLFFFCETNYGMAMPSVELSHDLEYLMRTFLPVATSLPE